MAGSFFVVPQWQGSSSSRAMRVAQGAEAIREDLPQSTTVSIPVPLGAGTDQGSGVRRLSSIAAVQAELTQALGSSRDIPIVVGGDCGVELGAIAHAARGTTLAVVWLDAHPDLNTPETSPSGAFHGMVLRTLLGEGPAELVPANPLPASRVILAGARAMDEAESEYIAEAGIRLIAPPDLRPGVLSEALRQTGAESVYIHVDLDVLDPGEFSSLGFPEPFGIGVSDLVGLIREVKAALPMAGAGVMEFAPGSAEQADDDLPAILRILGALAEAPG